MNNKNYQYSMNDLIATMTIDGATKDELERVIKYSAAVIDAERARKDLSIDELEKKYMTVNAYDKIIKEMADTAKKTGIPWQPKEPVIIPDVNSTCIDQRLVREKRCKDCAYLVGSVDGKWICDDRGRDIHEIFDEDCSANCKF